MPMQPRPSRDTSSPSSEVRFTWSRVAHASSLASRSIHRSTRVVDQAGATAVRDEAEGPAHDHEQPVLEPDEVPEVDNEPCDPGEEAAQLEPLDLGDGGRAADRREVALVAVAERRRLARAQAVAHDR